MSISLKSLKSFVAFIKVWDDKRYLKYRWEETIHQENQRGQLSIDDCLMAISIL